MFYSSTRIFGANSISNGHRKQTLGPLFCAHGGRRMRKKINVYLEEKTCENMKHSETGTFHKLAFWKAKIFEIVTLLE